MRIVATNFGDPGVLKRLPSAVQAPGKGEIVISVRAAAVNHRDLKIYENKNYAKGSGQDLPTFPLPIGVEAAGVVTAIGPEAFSDAGPIVVGDEVIAYRIEGAYADTIVIPAIQTVPKPIQLSWEQAASIMLTGTTAAHALAAVRARPGQTILIHAAASNVGYSAVQLAALDGIKIIGTASEKDFGLLEKYGVTPVKYGEGLLERVRAAAPTPTIDAALDFVGTNEAVDVSLQVVEQRSRIATIVAFEQAKNRGFLAVGGSSGQDPVGINLRKAARLRLTALAQANCFDVRIAKKFPLADAADAHRLLAKGGTGGHIVLIPDLGNDD